MHMKIRKKYEYSKTVQKQWYTEKESKRERMLNHETLSSSALYQSCSQRLCRKGKCKNKYSSETL